MSVVERVQVERRPEAVTFIRCRLDVTAALGITGTHTVAADLFLPPAHRGGEPAAVLCCLPGGALSKAYYDLAVPGDPTFSCGTYLAAQGLIVIALDHIGVGDSSRPAEGFALTPDLVARANARAFALLFDELGSGNLDDAIAALPRLVKVGVGHSMGALLTVVQQAHHRSYDGLGLLGFSNHFSGFLSEAETRFVGDPAGLRANLVSLARERFAEPYPVLSPNPLADMVYYGDCEDQRAINALKSAGTNLIALAALTAMIAGSVSPELKAIDVPVFLGIADQDICGPPHKVPAEFSSSRDVSLFVIPRAGHCPHIFPSRIALWERLACWVREVVAARFG